MAASEAEFVALWRDASLSVSDIAARLNVEVKSVSKRAALMRARGVALPLRGRPPATRDEAREELIVRLWSEGNSAGQIALGLGVTRNSVIGVLHRARLRLGVDAVPRRPTLVSKKREPRTPSLRLLPTASRPTAPEAPPIGGVHLMDLQSHHCRCVIGPEHYCGRPRVPGSSWCAEHRERFVTRRARAPLVLGGWR